MVDGVIPIPAVTVKSHYIDVIMTTMASQINSLTVVCSTAYSDADQRKHQSSAWLAFVWGIHRDRWIPRTKGQLHGKCFHLMTSSCIQHYVSRLSRWGNIHPPLSRHPMCCQQRHAIYWQPAGLTAVSDSHLILVNHVLRIALSWVHGKFISTKMYILLWINVNKGVIENALGLAYLHI